MHNDLYLFLNTLEQVYVSKTKKQPLKVNSTEITTFWATLGLGFVLGFFNILRLLVYTWRIWMVAWKFVFYSNHLCRPNRTRFWSLSALLKQIFLWWTSKSKGLSMRFLNYDSRIIKQMKLCSCKTLRSWQAYAIFLDICFITASENATSFRNALRPLMQRTVLGITFIYKLY